MHKITVYIPCHNHEKFINDAVESVLKQTHKNWELLIIDDASSDLSYNKIQIYKTNPKIKIFKTKGIGLPKVCNFAIKKSTGNYIIRLDGDDIFDSREFLKSEYRRGKRNLSITFEYRFGDFQKKKYKREEQRGYNQGGGMDVGF